ncbi:hypothetical protein SAMN04488018_1198 [Myroides marinus]|uniref:Uncharacterized protein n=1 Tax=Myroides marinus TaxID=703342 RepID=A0A1H6X5A8_9FLAO|nr:hypothetical protein [Myroides marinus]SEJ24371.1 hypothetical protein SAMN04488018_1198 [Myroides marinus]
MKKRVLIGAFALIASFANAQSRVSSTSIGINLGGLVSVVYDDTSALGLSKSQWRKINDCQARYERTYNDWAYNKRYSDYELNRKREQLYKEIRIEIGDVLTVSQREQWNNYNYKHNHYDRKHDHHHGKSNKYKDKHHKKHHKHKHDDCD